VQEAYKNATAVAFHSTYRHKIKIFLNAFWGTIAFTASATYVNQLLKIRTRSTSYAATTFIQGLLPNGSRCTFVHCTME